MPEVIGSYSANKPQSLDPQEQSPYYLIADLYFENMGALQAALQSPQGQAAAGDLQNFATGGVTLVAGEVQLYDPVSKRGPSAQGLLLPYHESVCEADIW